MQNKPYNDNSTFVLDVLLARAATPSLERPMRISSLVLLVKGLPPDTSETSLSVKLSQRAPFRGAEREPPTFMPGASGLAMRDHRPF